MVSPSPFTFSKKNYSFPWSKPKISWANPVIQRPFFMLFFHKPGYRPAKQMLSPVLGIRDILVRIQTSD